MLSLALYYEGGEARVAVRIWGGSTHMSWHCSNKLPPVEEYIQRRLGSSADGVMFAVTEYVLEIEMFRSVLYDANMLQAWDMANLLMALFVPLFLVTE